MGSEMCIRDRRCLLLLTNFELQILPFCMIYTGGRLSIEYIKILLLIFKALKFAWIYYSGKTCRNLMRKMLCPAETSIFISCVQPALLMFEYFKGLVPYLPVFQNNSPFSPLTHQLNNLDSILDCYLCQLKLKVKERGVIKSQFILFSRQNVLCVQEE